MNNLTNTTATDSRIQNDHTFRSAETMGDHSNPAAERELEMICEEIAHTEKIDYACPRNRLQVSWDEGAEDEGGNFKIHLGNEFVMPSNDHFNNQLRGTWKGFRQYSSYLETQGEEEFICENINRRVPTWDGKAMIRAKQNGTPLTARAFVSDAFKPVDDDLVFGTCLPIIGEQASKFRTLGGRRTDLRTYLKIISRQPIAKIGKREMFIGFELRNSEVGCGAVSFRAMFFDSFCENTCIFGKQELASATFRHTGARVETDFGQLMGDRIKQAEKAAIQGVIADATRLALDESAHTKIGELIERAHKRELKPEADLAVVLDTVAQKVGLGKEDRKQLPLHMDSEEPHAYGVQAAITALAQKSDSYDKRNELEQAGGKVLEMTDAAWNAVAALK